MRKYQFGGQEDPYSSDFFNQLVNAYQAQEASPESAPEQETPEAEDPYAGYNPDYEELQARYDELESQVSELRNNMPYQAPGEGTGDSFLDFLFSDVDKRKMPFDFSGYKPAEERARPQSTAGVNPNLLQARQELTTNYGLYSKGIWGDEAHQRRKSDHNTGDAEDYGFKSTADAQAAISKLQKEAASNKVKYIIYDGRIWNPSISNEWRPYEGPNPHKDHIHVSYNRQYGGFGRRPQQVVSPQPAYDFALSNKKPTAQDSALYRWRFQQMMQTDKSPEFWEERLQELSSQPLPFPEGDKRNKKFIQRMGDKLGAYSDALDHLKTQPRRLQNGGVAHSEAAQRQGLNDPRYDEMFFPMEGENTFRGLDSGEPVYLKDGSGQEQVLYGPKHTARMKGPVYEMRLQYGGPTGLDNYRRPNVEQELSLKRSQLPYILASPKIPASAKKSIIANMTLGEQNPTLSPARQLTPTEEDLQRQRKKYAWQAEGYDVDERGNPTSQRTWKKIAESKTLDRVANMGQNMMGIADLMGVAGAVRHGLLGAAQPARKLYQLADEVMGSQPATPYWVKELRHGPPVKPTRELTSGDINLMSHSEVERRLKDLFQDEVDPRDMIPFQGSMKKAATPAPAPTNFRLPFILGNGRAPNALDQINSQNVARIMGNKIGTGGNFNHGVYELNGFPEQVLKFEKLRAADQFRIPDYKDLNLAEMYKPLVDNPRIGSVMHQFPVSDEVRGLVMRKVANKPVYEHLDAKGIFNLPEESFANLYSDLKQARNNRLLPDFVGGNFGFDPKTSSFSTYDLVPIRSEEQVNTLKLSSDLDWILGGINPYKDPTISAKHLQDAITKQLDNSMMLSHNSVLLHKPQPAAVFQAQKDLLTTQILPKIFQKLGPYKYGGKYRFNGKKA